jgi:hypothetical protein
VSREMCRLSGAFRCQQRIQLSRNSEERRTTTHEYLSQSGKVRSDMALD